MQETHNINFGNSVNEGKGHLGFFFLVQDPLTGGAGCTSLLKMH